MGSSKSTDEKLEGLPFNSVKALKTAQDNLSLRAFERIELAKALYLMSKRTEYEFWNKEFEAGYTCQWEDKPLIRIHKNPEEEGIIVLLYDTFKQLPDDALRVTMSSGNIVKALADSFAHTYYLINGFLPISSLEPPNSDKKDP